MNYLLGTSMDTVREALLKLDAHERECTVRMQSIEDKFQRIEKRFDEGSAKFDRFDMVARGMYVLIIGLYCVEKFT
mgnify:FL=1|jgi:hypothetical protein|tara:strand:+ start:335 stop:562 length:228 start_codon:yes stop_codon:yes gene_type:complete